MDPYLERDLREVQDEVFRRHAGQRDFNGIGIGRRFVGGVMTDEPAVIVGVTKKRPASYIAEEKLLPTDVRIKGRRIRVDVIESGPYNAGGDAEFDPQTNDPVLPNPIRPLQQGTQIRNVNIDGHGTMSLFVRDLTDQSTGLLSNNHVLVQNNTGDVGDEIVQGDGTDPIATLKRFVPYKRGAKADNFADVGFAQFVSPRPEVSFDFPGARMARISSSHPVIGLHFAGDFLHYTNLVCKIENVLDTIGCELLDAPLGIGRATDVGQHIEKVGFRTGYSSSKVWALNWHSAVNMSLPDGERSIWFHDLILTHQFGWPGDSGSPVCLGGDGDTLLPLATDELDCPFLGSVGDMYDVPLQQDHAYVDQARDEFFSQSLMGNLLTKVFYQNGDVILDRSEGIEASDVEKSSAQSYYSKYRQFFIDALANPDRPGLVVTQEHLDDAAWALGGADLRLSDEESNAAGVLYEEILKPTLGMNHQQLVAYMDDRNRTNRVWDVLAGVSTLKVSGPFFGD